MARRGFRSRGGSAVAAVLLLAMLSAGSSCGADSAGSDAVKDAGPDLAADAPDEAGTDAADLPADRPGSDAADPVADGTVPDAAADVPDVLPVPDPPIVPADGRLRASYATRDLPVPLGTSTGGYGQTPPPDAPTSPFRGVFQATTTLLHPPRVQVVHLVKGDRRLLLLAGDLVAIFRPLQVRVQDLVRNRTGVDVSGSLVMVANHTHTGPGRLFDTPLGPLFSDTYREESFGPVADAMADAIVDAMAHRDLEPVRVGTGVLSNDRMHSYRRCPQTKVQDDSMIVARLERTDGTGTLAVLLDYAMHGTVFGYRDGVLGGDAPRSVELKVQEVLPGAPPVLFVQSWTGDMAPADPSADFADATGPFASLPQLDRLEALGRSAADTVLAGWDGLSWQDDPDLVVASAVAPMGVDAIGYAPGEWDHPAGAMLCGGGGSICDATPPAMDACLDVDYGWIPDTVRLSAFRLGTLAGVTLPGEPHTPLGLDLVARVRAAVPEASTAMLMGYANDYIGYLMLPDDWATGGYEPGMAFFGPRQGEYLRDAAASVAARLSTPDAPLSFVPGGVPPWAPGASDPYVPDASIDAGRVVQDLPPEAVSGVELAFLWNGGDPWVDRPEVVVETASEAGDAIAFEPLRIGGRTVDQRDYRVLLSVAPDPAWDVPVDGGRTFAWMATIRTAVRIPAPVQAMSGVVRVSVRGRFVADDGSEDGYSAVSNPTVLIPAH